MVMATIAARVVATTARRRGQRDRTVEASGDKRAPELTVTRGRCNTQRGPAYFGIGLGEGGRASVYQLLGAP